MPTKMLTGRCSGCGKPVVWAKCRTKEGRPYRVPLDPVPAVYMVTFDEALGVTGELANRVARKAEEFAESQGVKGAHVEYMVSHFATCPKASQFSQSGRRGGDRKGQHTEPPLSVGG